jgi:hypothetical protein
VCLAYFFSVLFTERHKLKKDKRNMGWACGSELKW